MEKKYPKIIINSPEKVIHKSSSSSVSSDNEEKGLTARRRKFNMKTPIVNVNAQKKFRRALIKLRGVYLFSKMIKEINMYGTNSHLLDIYGRYRKNIRNIMEEKKKSIRKPDEVVGIPFGLFLPYSSFTKYWNIFLILLLMHVFFIMPWTMAFSDSFTLGLWFFIEAIVDFCFFLDILITLNTAYLTSDEILISDRKKIFFNYLRGFLIIDILSVSPFYLMQNNASRSNNVIRVLRIFRFNRILRSAKQVKTVKAYTKKHMFSRFSKVLRSYGGLSRLARILFSVVIMTHFMACMWYYTARANNFNYDTWVVRFDFQDDSLTMLYMRGAYFAITVLTTVGFGDIFAFSEPEMFLVILWMLIGIGFYSVLVGTLSSVLSSLDIKVSAFSAMINEIDKFSKDCKVLPEAVKNMKSFIRSQKNHDKVTNKEIISFIEELPNHIRFEIAMQAYGGLAQKIEFFQNQDRTFVCDLVPRLEYAEFAKDMPVYKKNDFAESSYFLAEGRVCYFIGKTLEKFKTILPGAFFGEIEVIEKGLRRFTVVAEINSKMLVMSAQCFEYILEEYPKITTEIIKTAEKKNEENVKAMSRKAGFIQEKKKKISRTEKILKKDSRKERKSVFEDWVFGI